MGSSLSRLGIRRKINLSRYKKDASFGERDASFLVFEQKRL